VLQGTRLLFRRWKLLLITAIAGGAIGFAATFLLAPVFESEVDLQVGTLNGEPLEDPLALAKWLESPAFITALAAADTLRQPLRTQIVETRPGGPVAYIRIVTRGVSPEIAVNRAAQVVAGVKQRHATLADESRDELQQYEKAVADTAAQLEQSVVRLEGAVGNLPLTTQDSRVMASLFQIQLDAKRSEFLRLSRELRDMRLRRSLATRETRQLAPPSKPVRPVWPARTVFAVVGAALGLALAAVAAVLAG
jgi:uncharacterized protein involved in exopolysaccharide biosynthesis